MQRKRWKITTYQREEQKKERQSKREDKITLYTIYLSFASLEGKTKGGKYNGRKDGEIKKKVEGTR